MTSIEGNDFMANILITGATGNIGCELTRHLKENHRLTLVDIDFSEFPNDLNEGTTRVEADLVVADNWKGLLNNIDVVIHLAGQPSPDAEFYGDLKELNYEIPQNLYNEALEAEHLSRVIFASSIHAVHGYPQDVQVKVSDPVRPNNLYGVSKVYLEALASYHAYKNGIESIGIRIGDYTADHTKLKEDIDEYGMSIFLSARDLNQLVELCLSVELDEPYLLVNGLSNNTFPRLSLDEAREKLGYQPIDNAFEIPKE